MKKAIFVLVLAIGLGSVANAQDKDTSKKVVELKAKSVEKTRGANPEIKGKKPTTDEVKKEQTRGTYVCDLRLENWSDFCIDVYIDGYYHCTLSPMTYLETTSSKGYSTIYGQSCGLTTEWLQKGITCTDRFTYRFNP